MNKIVFRYLIGVLMLVSAETAWSHARLLATGSVPPRNDSAGLKVGPCGDIARTSLNTQLVAGEDLVIQWEEVVNHPGRFEFYFSEAGDSNWQLLATVQDDQNRTDDLPHRYTTVIKVPTTTCTNCTLQMIQVMTENPAAPRNYFSCADIEILPSGSVQPEPAPREPADDTIETCH